jgi:hypothetical protein
LTEDWLDLPADAARAAKVAGGAFKFMVTSRYMLAGTLLEEHYGSLETLTFALAFGIGVVGIKVNHVETPEKVARSLNEPNGFSALGGFVTFTRIAVSGC